MIKTREELRDYIKHDRERYGVHFTVFHPLIYSETYTVFRYVRNLRFLEFYQNQKSNIFYKPAYLMCLMKHRRLSLKTGITIAPNRVGKGLLLLHPGFRRIGPTTSVGDNCTILPNVLFGKKHPGDCSVVMGNNCYVGVNVTVLGPVKIGNNVTIGAGAVVVSDIPDNAVVGGVPAKIIKINSCQCGGNDE